MFFGHGSSVVAAKGEGWVECAGCGHEGAAAILRPDTRAGTWARFVITRYRAEDQGRGGSLLNWGASQFSIIVARIAFQILTDSGLALPAGVAPVDLQTAWATGSPDSSAAASAS